MAETEQYLAVCLALVLVRPVICRPLMVHISTCPRLPNISTLHRVRKRTRERTNGPAPAPTIHFNRVAQWRFEAKMLASFYHFRSAIGPLPKANLHTTLCYVISLCPIYARCTSLFVGLNTLARLEYDARSQDARA